MPDITSAFIDAITDGEARFEPHAYPTGSFLDAFANDDRLRLPLPFLWKVDISGITAGSIQAVISKAGDKWIPTANIDDYISSDTLLVAQDFTTPSESYTVSPMGVTNRGGFLPGYGVTERSDFISRGISINFIETHQDIEHEFIRPWTIAIGIDGLVNESLRSATITLTQLGNDGKTRKGMIFEGVFPTNCEGYTINYQDDEFKIKTVTFGCRNYKPL